MSSLNPLVVVEDHIVKSSKKNIIVEGKVCLGHTDYLGDGDCGYGVDYVCEECVFVKGADLGDKRYGKRPWSKSYR